MNYPKFSILMCTYNGSEFLTEQLDSIYNQNSQDWVLYVSDDGSTDETINILNSYKSIWGEKLTIFNGPQSGFCQNYLSLCARVSPQTDYFVWSDQDDIWLPNKLSRALELMDPLGQTTPVLYCAQTILVDRHNQQYGLSPQLYSHLTGFRNSLIQCSGGANTMVFNRSALNLIRTGYQSKLPSHDWWAYQIVSGAGGQVIYDNTPTLRYRQHGKNLVGTFTGLKPKIQRVRYIFGKNYKIDIDQNINALVLNESLLTEDNKKILHDYIRVHNSKNPLTRVKYLKRSKIYRQNFVEQMSLYLFAFFNLL
ncbi:MAG: glycosyltransferase family 2 protein [Deltaproteobacteria bacterium]|nr:glycosyltransferase family 2 protein [Deltaproteobacteria bacterium]